MSGGVGSAEMVPMFNVCRLTGSAPSFSPAASPRIRRRLSPWPSSCHLDTRVTSAYGPRHKTMHQHRTRSLAVLAITLIVVGCSPSPAPSRVALAIPTATAPSPSPSSVAGTTTACAPAAGGEALPSEDKALEARLPDSLNGVGLCKGSFRGNTILGSSPGSDVLALLARFGRTVDDYTMAIGSEPTASLNSLGAIRLTGVDGDQFLSAYLSLNQKANSRLQVAPATLGGKNVMVMMDPDGTTYIYANGDTLFYAQSTDPAWAAVGLAALP